MKISISLLCLFLVFSSCKNNDTDSEENSITEEQQLDREENANGEFENSSSNSNKTYENSSDEKMSSPDNDAAETSNTSKAITSGAKYVKMDETDSNCNCYCLELDMNNTAELCLAEDEMYINASFSKSGNNLNVYYVSPATKNSNEELPWKDFDTNTPIAVLSPGENGTMELDWKGFSIDGELAVDYAIYGKKTLEGTYKKQ